METTNRVLACVDQSQFADHVVDYGAWAAQRMGAPLELLHIIDRHEATPSGEDHSGAIGFDAQEKLLDQLSLEDEARTRSARDRGEGRVEMSYSATSGATWSGWCAPCTARSSR